MEDVHEWVRKKLKEGDSMAEIREELSTSGWSSKEIDSILADTPKRDRSDSRPEDRREPGRAEEDGGTDYALAVLFFVIAAAAGFLLSFALNTYL